MKAEVVRDTIVNGVRITTMRVEYPRWLLPEINTYRDGVARSTASNRAIPFEKMVKQVWTKPVLPPCIGKSHKGMSPKSFYIDGDLDTMFVRCMLKLLSKITCVILFILHKFGVAKSILNRYLECYTNANTLITGTEKHFNHFFKQRLGEDAEPNMQKVAELMYWARSGSKPRTEGIHLPFVTPQEENDSKLSRRDLCMISAARCARVSYTPHGEPACDTQKDLELAKSLLEKGHYAPFEPQVFSKNASYEAQGTNTFSKDVTTFRQFLGE